MNKKIMVCYDTDASGLFGKAEKVVFPKTIGQVQQIFKTSGLDIVPRGAGTNFVGGCVPDKSLVVDLGKINSVSGFDPIKKKVYVGAGVTLRELNEKLAAVGFEFPILSFNQGISTIGGLIAKNAFGGLKYGFIKDWIEEIEFVDGRGELMKTSKTDLMDVCGMEGITGIIVGVTLKIILKQEKTASVFQTESLDEALSIARRLKLEKDVIRLNFFSPQSSKFLGFLEKYYVIIEFDSDRGKVKGKDYLIMKKMVDNVYSKFYSKEYSGSEDFKFFFDKLKEFVLYLEVNKIPCFGLLGLGVIHSFFKNEEKDKKEEMMKFINRVNAKLGSNGVGLSRKNLLDSSETKIIKRIKLRHDPFGRLNKGKVIDTDPSISRPLTKEDVKHIKSIQIEDVEEIEPLFSEEVSVSKFEEPKKSPQEKIEEFIGEVKEVEKKEFEQKKVSETTNLLQDYEQTYKSELSEPKKVKIEEFAKNVPKEIEKRGKLSKEEQGLIDNVMMGGFGLKNNKIEDEGENKGE